MSRPKTRASAMRWDTSAYSPGMWAVSFSWAHTAAGMPRTRKKAAQVPPATPPTRGVTPRTSVTARARRCTTGAEGSVGVAGSPLWGNR